MEQGYKHFSHSHNLVMHQLPEGVDVSCSGCNSSGNGTVYICWACNFFLHEQCYRATRSLKHPSHPPHPLTLVPYPTYPSNSFYCNSCEIIGTGLSYSCAHCEFDLHVQCAYSISRATSFQKSHHHPTNYYTHDHQEVPPPNWHGQTPNIPHNPPFVSVPDNLQHPITSAQIPYVDPNAHSVYHSAGQDAAYVSIPPVRQNSDTHFVQNPSTIEDRHSNFIPGNTPYPIVSTQYPSMAETGSSVSIPPVTATQYPSITQHTPHVSVPANPHNLVTSNGVPSNPQYVPPTSSQNPVTSPLYPTLDVESVPIPTKSQNPIANDQKVNMAHNIASVPIPVSSEYQPDNHVESVQNKSNDKGITMHFSHPHSLSLVDIQDEDKEVDCSACEDTLEGTGFSCVEPNCNFHLHESCFFLKRAISHDSHPQHPLELLPLAPYKNENGEFTCNACFSDGTGFTYHCSICKYDLHIQCVNLPETVKRSDHEHMLKLHYSCPVKDEEYTFSCDVCHVDVQEDRWTYYCEECDYGTHLGCVDCEECVVDSVLDTQVQLQRLQLQMEMSRQHAQMIASMGASLLSLV